METDELLLIVDLLDAHIVNLEGTIAAISEAPELALIAQEGTELLVGQLALAQAAKRSLGAQE